MTTQCPNCRFENPDDTRFCGKCASPLHPTEEISSKSDTLSASKKDLTIGSTFARRYKILEKIGKGGMGRVYKVFDSEVKEKIALKVINPEIASDEQTIERFRNELKFARKISHKNVCRMYDLNDWEGYQYITMEYVRGEDLQSTLLRIGPLSVRKAVSIARQICEGLIEAHNLKVVHRDLKPRNIMIDRRGNAQIMDFGIARSLTKKSKTTLGVLIGTPEYMSPEQMEGQAVDERTDIYSLGVILYRMVTGEAPFEGETPLSIALKQKTEEPRNPSDLNSSVPRELSQLIMKCLEKNKEKRYQTAIELLDVLESGEKDLLRPGPVPPPKISAPLVPSEKGERKKPVILVVDDKEVNVELLDDLLSPFYNVQTAFGGREALEKAQSDLPDLILLDIMMPEIDGYEVCRQLKSKPSTSIIPVVMVTALKEKIERIKALEVGADDFLSKPVDKAELLARVKSILRIKRLHDELLEVNRTLERKVLEQVGQIQSLSKLKQYFSPKLAERLVSEKDIYRIRRKSLTIFFVDIRNFYAFSEMMEPEELVTLLDKFFLEMTQVIFDWEGTVGKFISDGILGFFGDPEECPNHAELAVKMAQDMQHQIKLLNEESPFWKEHPLSIGIGINTGYVTVGNIGPENHRDYTVIGRNVHLAARLEEEAKPGQILISQRTHSLVENIVKTENIGTLKVKGFDKPVSVYSVLELI